MSGYEETMSAICKTLIEMNAFGLKTKILLNKTWQISYNSMTPSDRSEHKHTGSDDKSTQTDTAQKDSQLLGTAQPQLVLYLISCMKLEKSASSSVLYRGTMAVVPRGKWYKKLSQPFSDE